MDFTWKNILAEAHLSVKRIGESADEEDEVEDPIPPGQQCDKCSKKNITKSNLERHKKAAHSGLQFACDYCGQPGQVCQKHYVKNRHLQVVSELQPIPGVMKSATLRSQDFTTNP